MTTDREVRLNYHLVIGRLIYFVDEDGLTPAELIEFANIKDQHSWDGLSCSCGGGWLVGHAAGCPEAAVDNTGQPV